MPHIEIGLVFQIFQFRCVLECCKWYLGDKSCNSLLQLVEQNEKTKNSETLQTLQVNFSKEKHVFHNIPAHRGRLNPCSNSLESSCSALIPLCFLMHWPGMWWYFITEAEATSLVSSLGALAAHLDEGNCMCNHNGMLLGVQAQLCIECPNQARRNFQVRSWDRSARRWEKRRGPGASATLKTCQPQWTRTTMKWASSLSSSEWKLWYLSLLLCCQSDLINSNAHGPVRVFLRWWR